MNYIKILETQLVERYIPIEEFLFLKSNNCVIEFIDLSEPFFSGYINDPRYPQENFLLIYQEIDTTDYTLHELGYVVWTKPVPEFDDEKSQYLDESELKQYILDNIDSFVQFED